MWPGFGDTENWGPTPARGFQAEMARRRETGCMETESFSLRAGLGASFLMGKSEPGGMRLNWPRGVKNLAREDFLKKPWDSASDSENGKGPWEKMCLHLQSECSQMFPVWPLKFP